MGGALRIQVRADPGVAWLLQSLVEPDISCDLLTWAGGEEWAIDVNIRLHRLRRNHNMLIRKIMDVPESSPRGAAYLPATDNRGRVLQKFSSRSSARAIRKSFASV